MSRIVVFGAGGRAGRTAVEEAVRRGHEVTAVVRDPAKYGEPASGVRVVSGDVLDAGSVAEVAAGHDAAVAGVYDAAADQERFFAGAAQGLSDGLHRARVARLVWVGLASLLPTASGTLLMDTPGYPNEYRSFYPRARSRHRRTADIPARLGRRQSLGRLRPRWLAGRRLLRCAGRCGQPDHVRRLRSGTARRDRTAPAPPYAPGRFVGLTLESRGGRECASVVLWI